MKARILTVGFAFFCCFLQPVFAGDPLCEVRFGCIGNLKIGQSRLVIEGLLGKKLNVDFSGDDRVGVTIDEQVDIAKLKLLPAMGVSIKAVDIFFIVQREVEVIEMISIGVPCKDVDVVRSRYASNGVHPKLNSNGGWRVLDTRYAFVWGADKRPTCRFWLRPAY